MANNKRLQDKIDDFTYKGEKTPLSLGTLVVVCACLLLLIIATFVQFNICHFLYLPNQEGIWELKTYVYPYIAQIPVVIFISAVLGVRFGILTVLLYVLMGFFAWPVFAFGGGLSYIKTFFFGYILGYFPCVFFVSFFLRKYKGFKGILFAVLSGVLSVNVVGLLYSIILLIFRQIDFRLYYGCSGSCRRHKIFV
jgi:biotin transport system substrate-specific component